MDRTVFRNEQGEIVVLYSDPDAVVRVVNSKIGPDLEVRQTGDGRGYGLFAMRDFLLPEERVVTYGGRQYSGPSKWDDINEEHRKNLATEAEKESAAVDYVVTVGENYALDTGLFFRPEHAGRYVNESALGQNWMANVVGTHQINNAVVDFWFKTKKPIFKGDEIIAYYGDQYGLSKYGNRGPPWRWNKREPTSDLLDKMRAVVQTMEQRLEQRKKEKRYIEEAKYDLKQARTQLATKERAAQEEAEKEAKQQKKARLLKCELCGNLAQHQEEYGKERLFCDKECQKEFYQRLKRV